MKFKVFVSVLLFLIIINLLFLNYMWHLSIEERKATHLPDSPELTDTVNTDTFAVNEMPSIDSSLTSQQIKEATSSLTKEVELLKKNSNVSVVTATQQPVSRTNSLREYYIPLGTGTANAQEWVDVPGVEAYVAPANYGSVREMYFEASFRIPAGVGQAYVRIRNVTDNVALFESEIMHEGMTGKLISSGKIPVPTNTKLYRVQIKSSLGAQVLLDNARLKLFAY